MKKNNKPKVISKAKEELLNEEKQKRNKKIVISVIVAVISVVLILAIVFGTVAVVRNAKFLVSYKGVGADEGVVNYLGATYKKEFMKKVSAEGIEASDSEYFWGSEYKDGETFDEVFEREVRRYIKGIVVSAYLFDRYTSLKPYEKDIIKRATEEVLTYKAGGSEAKFNEMTADMGFDYNDFKNAQTLIYKSSHAMLAIYGRDGDVLKNGGFLSETEEFFKTYSHVKLLFIRTEDDFKVDSEGNRIQDKNGNDILEPLSDSEKKKREEDIQKIRDSIVAYENDGEFQMTEQYFSSFYKSYNYDREHANLGYYFAKNSAFTNEFKKELKDVVETSLSMEIGEYKEVKLSFGVCFVMKTENGRFDFADSNYKEFFEDFYRNASIYLFADSLNQLSSDVKVKEDFDEIDFSFIPYNSDFIAKF